VAAWRLRVLSLNRRFRLVLAERARIGRELHDTLLQSLVGLGMQFDHVEKTMATAPDEARAYLRRLRQHIEVSSREARQAVLDLRSADVARRDLASALRHTG